MDRVAWSGGGAAAGAGLALATREVATIAMLAATGGSERRLAAHVAAALSAGVAAPELRALCAHVAVHAGLARALDAAVVVDEVVAEAGLPGATPVRRLRLADHETVVAQRGGRGPAVVLVHALGLDWRMWEPVMGPLSAGRRVYAYDVRSHGAAAGSPVPFTMAEAAADLLAVLDALGVGRAHLVGLGYGGGIVQTVAVGHPERLASMALLASPDGPVGPVAERARAAEADGMEAMVVPSLTAWFTPGALATDGWGVRYARERVRRAIAADWTASWRALEGLDVRGRLRSVAWPTLILAGALDAAVGPEAMAGTADRIAGAAYEELPGTPHMQTLERPGLVAAALDAFLPRGRDADPGGLPGATPGAGS
jgi:3-oxoadipate enol-lactonase